MYTRTGFDDLTPDWTGENELIDYHTELSNYREKQQQYNINIPLMLQFQMPLANGNHQFFAMVGAKLGMQLKSFYNVNTELYTWYYDYKSNQEFRPDPADYGNPWLEDLGCFYNLNYSTKQKNQFKMAGLATAEMGIKWQLNPKLSLYTGIYVDYGFNNISKQNDNRFFEFDPVGVRMNSNSVLTSQYAHNGGDVKSFTDKVVPVSFGIKIRMGINMCKSEKRRKPEDVYIHVRDTIQNIIHDTVLKIDTVIELTEPMIKQVESVVKQTEPIVEYVEPKISKDTPVIQQPIHEQLKKLDPSEPQEQPQQVKSQVQHQQTTQSPATIELPVVSASDPDLRYRVQIMATLKQVKNYRQVVAELLQAMPQLKLEVLFDANNDGFYRYVTEPYLTHTEAEIIHAKIKELHIKSKIWTNQQAFISTYKGNDRVRIEL
jgi:hypothetical protein